MLGTKISWKSSAFEAVQLRGEGERGRRERKGERGGGGGEEEQDSLILAKEVGIQVEQIKDIDYLFLLGGGGGPPSRHTGPPHRVHLHYFQHYYCTCT